MTSVLKQQLKKRLQRTHELFLDLLDFIPKQALSSKLEALPSNTLGQQFWCVVGARNSYIKAAIADKWVGFECPLKWEESIDPEAQRRCLHSTYEKIISFFDTTTKFTQIQEDFLWDLLEHEVQHHGQMIRYLYGLKLGAPTSWKKRYNLD